MGVTGRNAQPMRSFTHKAEFPPDADLPAHLAELWRRVVAETPEGQLREGDRPLLRAFVEVSALARQANERLLADGQVIDGKPSPWVSVSATHSKTLATLASKLRLNASARIRPESAALQATAAGPRPWDRHDPASRRYLDDDELIPR